MKKYFKEVNVSIVVYSNKKYINKFKKEILEKSIIHLTKNKFVNKILIIDNSEKDYFKFTELLGNNVKYFFSNENLGYGRGHNLSKKLLEKKKFHLILNPDIAFYENQDLIKDLLCYFDKSNNIVLLQPNIVNYLDEKNQYLCKRNPSLLIQLLRGFGPKYFKNLFIKYNNFFEMRDLAYQNQIVESQYLSGCFMFCKTSALNKINWFDEDFFMYLEDADLTRRLSRIGKCLHIPYLKIMHVWEKGSHKKLKLKLEAIRSFFIYSYKWGLKIW